MWFILVESIIDGFHLGQIRPMQDFMLKSTLRYLEKEEAQEDKIDYLLWFLISIWPVIYARKE